MLPSFLPSGRIRRLLLQAKPALKALLISIPLPAAERDGLVVGSQRGDGSVAMFEPKLSNRSVVIGKDALIFVVSNVVLHRQVQPSLFP